LLSTIAGFPPALCQECTTTEDAALDGKFEVLASLFELLEDIDLDRRQNPT